METSNGVFTDSTAVLGLGSDWGVVATCTPINIIVQNRSAGIVVLSDLTPNPGDAPVFVSDAVQPATDRQIIRVDASRITVVVS